MTSDRLHRHGVSAREAGRQLSVSHTYLLRLAGQKRLPRHEDGTFDVAACRNWLAKNTDPSQVRGPNSLRWSESGNPVTSDQSETKTDKPGVSRPWDLAVAAAEHAGSPFEKGMTAAVVMLAHRIGAAMAVLAADEGASLPVAFGLKDAATLGFMELGEELLRELPSFSDVPADTDLPLRYEPAAFDTVDWDVVACERGETADARAWAAAVRERRKEAAA